MKLLKLLYYVSARRFYRRAMEDIATPLHPDVPKIRLRQVEIDDRLKELLA